MKYVVRGAGGPSLDFSLTKGVNGLTLYVIEFHFEFVALQSMRCHYKHKIVWIQLQCMYLD